MFESFHKKHRDASKRLFLSWKNNFFTFETFYDFCRFFDATDWNGTRAESWKKNPIRFIKSSFWNDPYQHQLTIHEYILNRKKNNIRVCKKISSVWHSCMSNGNKREERTLNESLKFIRRRCKSENEKREQIRERRATMIARNVVNWDRAVASMMTMMIGRHRTRRHLRDTQNWNECWNIKTRNNKTESESHSARQW